MKTRNIRQKQKKYREIKNEWKRKKIEIKGNKKKSNGKKGIR